MTVRTSVPISNMSLAACLAKAIEVLAKNLAYVPKRPAPGSVKFVPGQITFSKHGGPVRALEIAKANVGLGGC